MGSETRDRLLDEAERLFGRGSIAGVSTREIVEAAEQRNTSAISYHFGSREGLLLAILARRGGPIDRSRGQMRADLGPHPDLVDLVRCLVEPYAEQLATSAGQSYLRIVSQLRGRFASWRIESDEATTVQLASILDEIENFTPLEPAIRRERVVAMIMLMTATSSERARVLDEQKTPALSHVRFVSNVVEMCAAVVLAGQPADRPGPGS